MIDAWSGPTPSPQQFPTNEPNGIRKLLDKIKALELQVKESTSNLLRTAGIYLSPTGMTIDSNLALTGTLSLPAGIIDNAALANPVKSQSIYSSASNFALTTTPTTLKTVTITVPAGFTSAVVTVLARVFAINPNSTGGPAGTGLDYLFCHPTAGAVSGAEMPLVATGSQGSAMNLSPLSTVLTGLTGGGTFTVTVNASTDYLSWTAFTNNIAEISGNILWFR